MCSNPAAAMQTPVTPQRGADAGDGQTPPAPQRVSSVTSHRAGSGRQAASARRACGRGAATDTGASLVFALVFISVICDSVVISVLSLADGSMRAAPSSCAAGRLSACRRLKAPRTSPLSTRCARDSYTGWRRSLRRHVGPVRAQQPAAWTRGQRCRRWCRAHPTLTMARFPLGAPAQAILATAADALPAITVKMTSPTVQARRTPACASVATSANAGIYVGAQAQVVAENGGVVRTRSGCVLPPGVITTFPFVTPAGTITPNPTSAQCSVSPTFPCPECAVPSAVASIAGQTAQSVPACAPIMTFTPGRYTDVAGLNNYRTTGRPPARTRSPFPARRLLLRFRAEHDPGPVDRRDGHHSDAMDDQQRIADRGRVGSARHGRNSSLAHSCRTACKSPAPIRREWLDPPTPGDGVRFIFSGYSQASVPRETGRAEICGEYAGNAPNAS